MESLEDVIEEYVSNDNEYQPESMSDILTEVGVDVELEDWNPYA